MLAEQMIVLIAAAQNTSANEVTVEFNDGGVAKDYLGTEYFIARENRVEIIDTDKNENISAEQDRYEMYQTSVEGEVLVR